MSTATHPETEEQRASRLGVHAAADSASSADSRRPQLISPRNVEGSIRSIRGTRSQGVRQAVVGAAECPWAADAFNQSRASSVLLRYHIHMPGAAMNQLHHLVLPIP